MKAAGLSETQAQVIIEQVQIIQSDEATHASTLSSVITSLGGTPNTACGFNVDAVLTDVCRFFFLPFIGNAGTNTLLHSLQLSSLSDVLWNKLVSRRTSASRPLSSQFRQL